MTLRVSGVERLAEVYLVRNGEQYSLGRGLSSGNTLVTENLQAGNYTLVQLTQNGEEKKWEIAL